MHYFGLLPRSPDIPSSKQGGCRASRPQRSLRTTKGITRESMQPSGYCLEQLNPHAALRPTACLKCTTLFWATWRAPDGDLLPNSNLWAVQSLQRTPGKLSVLSELIMMCPVVGSPSPLSYRVDVCCPRSCRTEQNRPESRLPW